MDSWPHTIYIINGFYVNEMHYIGNIPQTDNENIQYENIKSHAFYLDLVSFKTRLIRYNWIDEENHHIYTDKQNALIEVLKKIDEHRKSIQNRITKCQK